MKNNEMARACGMFRRDEKCIQGLVGEALEIEPVGIP